MYISNALLLHGYSSFSLTILEYIDISNLSKDEARKLILEREQHYIDSLSPVYNINPIAGSRLGSGHTQETIARMSEIKKGENNPNFGKIHSIESRAKMSKPKTEQTKAKMRKPKAEQTITKMSIAKGGGIIYIYDTNDSLVNSFNSTRKTAKFLNCSHVTIAKYIKNGKLFNNKWILSLDLK
jgi:group I intron endonuclease